MTNVLVEILKQLHLDDVSLGLIKNALIREQNRNSYMLKVDHLLYRNDDTTHTQDVYLMCLKIAFSSL